MKLKSGVLDLKRSGLKIHLSGRDLKLSDDISYSETIKREAKDLNKVLYQPVEDPHDIIYKVWKNIALKTDRKKIESQKLSYDITAIFHVKIGRELPKTFGHYHSLNDFGVAYPEIYEVIFGQAWFLIQKPEKLNPKALEEIYLVEAKAGDKIIVPPGFGHVSSNPTEKELVLANWRNSGFSYDYETFSNLRGAGYYFLESKTGNEIEFEKNAYYDKVPEIIKLYPKPILMFDAGSKKTLYELIENSQNLDFLNNPQKYLKNLTIDSCFNRVSHE